MFQRTATCQLDEFGNKLAQSNRDTLIPRRNIISNPHIDRTAILFHLSDNQNVEVTGPDASMSNFVEYSAEKSASAHVDITKEVAMPPSIPGYDSIWSDDESDDIGSVPPSISMIEASSQRRLHKEQIGEETLIDVGRRSGSKWHP